MTTDTRRNLSVVSTTTEASSDSTTSHAQPGVDARVHGWFADTQAWLLEKSAGAQGVDEHIGVANACTATLTGLTAGVETIAESGYRGVEFEQWLSIEVGESALDPGELTAMYGNTLAGRRAINDHLDVLRTYAALLASLQSMLSSPTPPVAHNRQDTRK